MISFSTSWADGDISKVLGILPHIDSVEVGSRGKTDFFGRMERLALDHALTVRSIHTSAGPHKRLHDPSYTKYFASCDSEKREKDIDDVLRTAEWAEKIGAENIVLHAGTVADETLRSLYLEYRRRFLLGEEKTALADLKAGIIRMRPLHSANLDLAADGLERLCRSFPDINFCFETRLHYHEIPTPDEAAYLFDRVRLPNLFYWHDIGHTWALDRLGFVRQTEWQHRFGERCRGIHVHDAGPDLKDHLPPGTGVMDLEGILREFDTTLPYTLEIHPRHTAEEVISGIDCLTRSVASRSASR